MPFSLAAIQPPPGIAEPKLPHLQHLQTTQTHQSSSSQPTDDEKIAHPWKYGKLSRPSSSSFSLLSYLADTTPQLFPVHPDESAVYREVLVLSLSP
jgi:hypothetical protein